MCSFLVIRDTIPKSQCIRKSKKIRKLVQNKPSFSDNCMFSPVMHTYRPRGNCEPVFGMGDLKTSHFEKYWLSSFIFVLNLHFKVFWYICLWVRSTVFSLFYLYWSNMVTVNFFATTYAHWFIFQTLKSKYFPDFHFQAFLLDSGYPNKKKFFKIQ